MINKVLGLLCISLALIVKLYYGPTTVGVYETDKVYYRMGYIQFIDNATGNEINMMGTWVVIDDTNAYKGGQKK